MSLSIERRGHIDTAIAAGRSPVLARSGQTNLSLKQNPGRSSYALLARADGSLTPAGSHFYAVTNTPKPSRQFDRAQPLIKKSSADYVRTRSGQLALVRVLRADGTTHVTRLGKQYFRGGKTEYVVSIPAIVSGSNARGRIQNRQTMVPVDMLNIGRIMQDSSLPAADRISRVKSYVLQQLSLRTSGGMTILAEVSGETFSYDRTRPWLISEMTTTIQDGEAVTSAVMRQPLGAGPLSCAAFLPFPEEIVDAAWETHDDRLCVPRQLAAVLGVSLDEAMSYFDEFLKPGWQEWGVAPLELKELCRRQGRSFYFLNGHRMLDAYEPPAKNHSLKSISLTCWGGACLYVQVRQSGVYEKTCCQSWVIHDARAPCERLPLRASAFARMEGVVRNPRSWLPPHPGPECCSS